MEIKDFMKTKLLKSIVAITAAGFFAAGCDVYVRPPAVGVTATVPGEVEVDAAPPPAQVDVETPMPGPGFVWIGGVWAWGPGGRWIWQGGHWDHPPRSGAVWVPHRYEYRNGRHVFVRGGWR
jgi:hypothetical protein